ncbi:unnamed protein product [Sympodiomycopsis kandeliae]
MVPIAMPMESEDHSPHSPVEETNGHHASSSSSSSGYQFYLGDSDGMIKSFTVPVKSVEGDDEQIALPSNVYQGGSSKGSGAVQRMVGGVIDGVGYVLAVARKNATIDILQPSSEPSSSTSSSSSPRLIKTIKNPKMKAGLQRWVGLSICDTGVYACTSAGDWTFTRVQADQEDEEEEDVVHRVGLPEPLQSCIFYPEYNPRYFLYGGEQVPLSIWDIECIKNGGKISEGDDDNEEEDKSGDTSGLNAKQRKRKRQIENRAKAKELLPPGEIWRAKNLANDALSLPRRPNISSIGVVGSNDTTAVEPGTVPSLQIAVGTRDGLIRMYDPSSGVRKYTKEIRVVPHTSSAQVENSAIKAIYTGCTNNEELIASDGSGRLTCVNHTQGKSLYQWKDIKGSITSVATIQDTNWFLSSSFDRLLRTHTYATGTESRGKVVKSTFTGGSNVTSIVWDGIVPDAAEQGNESISMRNEDDDGSEDSEEGEEEEVWNEMQQVGTESRHRTNGEQAGGEEEDEKDEEKVKEERSKRSKNTKKGFR